MLSEGALRAERICRELERYSRNRGVSEEELEDVTFILLGAWSLQSESQLHVHLPSWRAAELEELISNILNDGDPDSTEHQLHELRLVISQAMDCEWIGVNRTAGVLALAIRHIAGMLMHELSELGQDTRKYVLDVLFYKLFARLIPTVQKHNELIARHVLPLAKLFGGVAETQPGPGEIFTLSGFADCTDLHFSQNSSELPAEAMERIRFLRNLRLAVHDIPFGNHELEETSGNIWLWDYSLEFKRTAYGDKPVTFINESNIQRLLNSRRNSNNPMIVVMQAKDRRKVRNQLALRRELVEHHQLRAVIDFTSFTTKGTNLLGLWYFGPSFPKHEDQIVQIDARQLRANTKSDEVFTCASLIGTILRAWIEGEPISKSILEQSEAPRRVIAFIDHALGSGDTQIPGFVRFVDRHQMMQKDYSLRAEDYVTRNEDRTWRPEVEIDPILINLSPDTYGQSMYLIGDNGAGKSLALRDIAIALAWKEQHSFGVSFGTTDRFERSARTEPLKSYFTYAGARNFHNGPNARRSLGELGDMVREIFDTPHRLSSFEAALDQLGFQPKQYLVPVSMSSTSDHLQRTLAEIHPLSDLSTTDREQAQIEQRRALTKGAYKIAVMRHDSPEIVVFDALSSGEQQILTMVIKIVANVQRDTTVLLDEPEISLHVAWQRQLPHVLRNFSEALGCSFVVATHSPIVIASASDIYDHCFVMKKGRLKELKASERKSVEASLFQGFQTYTPYTHHIQERCAEIISRVVGDSDERGQIWADENQFLVELESLKQSLDETIVHGAASDRSLVDKAIAAVREIMTP